MLAGNFSGVLLPETGGDWVVISESIFALHHLNAKTIIAVLSTSGRRK
jgi:hypothetical protein